MMKLEINPRELMVLLFMFGTCIRTCSLCFRRAWHKKSFFFHSSGTIWPHLNLIKHIAAKSGRNFHVNNRLLPPSRNNSTGVLRTKRD